MSSVRVERSPAAFPTYTPAAPQKNPMFLEHRVYQGSSGRVYPLPVVDRIADQPVTREWDAVHIENEFLHVMILPEIGGRIHVVRDQTNGYDLVYRQRAIKPALVGLAGPWLSGGIEFNWPQHHRPATFMPVDVEIEEHADGSKTVWLSDHDPMLRMKGMHGVCLHPGRAVLELKVRAYNRTPLPQTFLWWANVATEVHEGYQSFFPPDVHYVADHAKRAMSTYPRCEGYYYGVNYGARPAHGIPAAERPTQFIPPYLPGSSGQAKRSVAYAPNDLGWYANIPVPTSYMAMGSRENFFGGYDHFRRAGIVHVANRHISPGKKQWTWGNSAFGYAWDRNLTTPDEHGVYPPYIEIMAGVYTDNQPDFSFLQPGETKTWSQFWYPIREIGPARHANVEAAVSVRSAGRGEARIGVAVTRPHAAARVVIEARGKTLNASTVAVAPDRPHVATVRLPRGVKADEVGVTVWTSRAGSPDPAGKQSKPRAGSGAPARQQTEELLLRYTPKSRPGDRTVPPPATEPRAPAEITSIDQLYLTGVHLDQYRHATRKPELYWREALRRDAGDARCNQALGAWHLRRGEFDAAERHLRAAIARLTERNPNPLDGEPSYTLGVVLRHLGRDDEAYDAFYKAAWNQAWQAAAYHALAEIDCTRGDWDTALDHLERALRMNTDNLRARDLKTMVLRQLGRDDEAQALLRATLALDPLDWWARWLRVSEGRERTAAVTDRGDNGAPGSVGVAARGRGQATADQITPTAAPGSGCDITCDTQTRLDIAHDLARAGFYAEAIGLLEGAKPEPYSGTAPLVAYTLAWLNERWSAMSPSRLSKQASPAATPGASTRRWLRRAAAASPDYCFPARLEELTILRWAMAQNPRDARAPFYLGNLLYDRRRYDEAIACWEKAARLEPRNAVAWRNLGIAYFNVRRQPARARRAYDRARQADPSDARVLFERDQLWKRLGVSPRQRRRELERHPELVRQRDDLTIELCALYNLTGQPQQAAALLGGRRFQPWEGGEGQALGQHLRAHLALGRAALGRGEAAEAQRRFEQALAAPENLGEARHPLANASEIHYWLGEAAATRGDPAAAREHWKTAATFSGDFQEMAVRAYSEPTYYSALACARLGDKRRSRRLLSDLLAYARGLVAAEAKVDYFATSLPTMLLFNDDLQFRQQTTALFLQAQAERGLGRRSAAKQHLRQVLRRDPSHALAAEAIAAL